MPARSLPLLAMIEGHKPRIRRAPIVISKELELHMAVAKLLRQHCRPDWEWTHIPLGESRGKIVAAKLKRMGANPGWADFTLVEPVTARMYSLELKRLGGRLNEAQKQYRDRCVIYCRPHVIADDISQVMTVLAAWGCLRPEITQVIREQDAARILTQGTNQRNEATRPRTRRLA